MNIRPDEPSIHSWLQFALALERSADPSLGPGDSLFAADQLLRHGCHGHACKVIERLTAEDHRNATFGLRLKKLVAMADQVRLTAGLPRILKRPGMTERMLSFRSLFLRINASTERLVVVYATAYNNFDISFPFLHVLLEKHADCVLYVKNPARGMYATGNHEHGDSIDAMSSRICGLIQELKARRVTVMGFSGGGYAALHLAAKARASAFHGFGIKTDWSIDSALSIPTNRVAPVAADYPGNTLVNMRSLPGISGIEKAVLHFGDQDPSDREQALNMAGLPNFELRALAGGSHNLICNLLERGLLAKTLREAVEPGSP
jgi:hypothetical protein